MLFILMVYDCQIIYLQILLIWIIAVTGFHTLRIIPLKSSVCLPLYFKIIFIFNSTKSYNKLENQDYTFIKENKPDNIPIWLQIN